MDKLLKKDFQMLLRFNNAEFSKQSNIIYIADDKPYYSYPNGIEKNINYLKIIINNFNYDFISPNLMINLEYLEIPKAITKNIQVSEMSKLRTLVIKDSDLDLDSIQLLNNLPFNLENIIFIIKPYFITSFKFLFTKIEIKSKSINLPVSLKRIIFYTTDNKVLTKIVKNNIDNIKIPFDCRIFVDKTEISNN